MSTTPERKEPKLIFSKLDSSGIKMVDGGSDDKKEGPVGAFQSFFIAGTDPRTWNKETITAKKNTKIDTSRISLFDVPLENSILRVIPANSEEKNIPKAISSFCFPDGLKLQSEKQSPKIFCFISTNAVGERTYITCLSVSEVLPRDLYSPVLSFVSELVGRPLERLGDKDIFVPKCFCLLSTRPFFDFSREWLKQLYKAMEEPSPHISPESLISNLIYSTPMPKPGGGSVVFQTPLGTLPPLVINSDASFPALDVPLHLIFAKLGMENVMLLVRAILLGEKVLYVSSTLSLLTLFAEGINSLLFPFTSDGIFVYIPLVPKLLIDYLDTPSSFVCGISPEQYKLVQSRLPDVIVVNLDDNTVHCPIAVPQFGTEFVGPLRKHLAASFEPLSKRYDDLDWSMRGMYSGEDEKVVDRNIRFSFFQLFAQMLREYRNYLIYQQIFPTPTVFFDAESYVRDVGYVNRDPFLKRFVSDSQLFTNFYHTRPWPCGDIFDFAIAQGLWDMKIENFCEGFFPDVPPPDVKIVLEPSLPRSPPPRYNIPLIMLPFTFKELPSPPETPALITYSSLQAVASFVERKVTNDFDTKKIDDFFITIIRKSDKYREIRALFAELENRDFRQHFLLELLRRFDSCAKQNELELSPKNYDLLGSVLEHIIQLDPTDYCICQLCLDVGEKYFTRKDHEGLLTVSQKLKTMDVWQSMRLWHFIFAVRLHNSLQKVYSSDDSPLSHQVTQEDSASFQASEWAFFKTQMLTTIKRMKALKIDIKIIREFIGYVCGQARIPQEQENFFADVTSSL